MGGLFFRWVASFLSEGAPYGGASILVGGGGFKKNCKMGGALPGGPPPPPPPTLWETLYISSHREARKIKFGKLVNLIQRVRLGTLPQEVMMALSHNYVTNLFISSYRGASV